MAGSPTTGLKMAFELPVGAGSSFKKVRWVSWLLGAAFLGGVVIIASHASEGEAFLRLILEAKPLWLVAAFVLQAATYVAQGEIWRNLGRRAGHPLPFALMYKLALAKLFVDQALPSAGLSGTIVVAQVLEQGALPRVEVLAGAVVNTTSFFFAYVVSLAGALIILSLFGQANAFTVVSSVVFMLLSAGLGWAMMALSGKDIGKRIGWAGRLGVVRDALEVMKDADPKIARDIRLQLIATGYQFATFLLDALTLWMLIRSLGAAVHPSYVFASFMLANLVRTIGIVPGGLGVFEAASVLMLRAGGVSVAVALSATLLFRGLTFVLPMAPGMWYSRRLTKAPRSR